MPIEPPWIPNALPAIVVENCKMTEETFLRLRELMEDVIQQNGGSHVCVGLVRGCFVYGEEYPDAE